jgi:hypothetical protein
MRRFELACLLFSAGQMLLVAYLLIYSPETSDFPYIAALALLLISLSGSSAKRPRTVG